MNLQFKPITLDDQTEYKRRLALCPQKASDYSFINLWGWAEEYGLKWAHDSHLTWIKQTKPETQLWAPIGPWFAVDWNQRLPKGRLDFVRIPEKLYSYWKKSLMRRVDFNETRGDWDYVYDTNLLIELKGKSYHKKKNLLNQFEREYVSRLLPLEEDLIEQALNLQERWCTWRDCESSDIPAAENRVIQKVLNRWNDLDDIFGAVLYIDGFPTAYTVSEPLDSEMIVIHFEKCNTDYKGIYQAVNQKFLAAFGEKYKKVNREQDLDEPGLRKAKQSYHPVEYIKKFQVTID